jgi:hypothetical protein
MVTDGLKRNHQLENTPARIIVTAEIIKNRSLFI